MLTAANSDQPSKLCFHRAIPGIVTKFLYYAILIKNLMSNQNKLSLLARQ